MVNNCDTDSAALERLSQLLTTTTASEVSTTDLIALHEDKEAPMASQEESLGVASSNSTTSEADPNKSNVFQELDDAFTTLDQELDADDQKTVSEVGNRTLDPNSATNAPDIAVTEANNDNDKSGLIVSAPTPI